MGLPTTVQNAIPGEVYSQSDYYGPSGQGDHISHLMSVVRKGRQTLVGSVASAGMGIYDFGTGEVIYDFKDFDGIGNGVGRTNRIGFDAYCAQCQWRGWYVFGGWVKTPAILGTSSNHTNKFAYVVATQDFTTWKVILKDQTTAGEVALGYWAKEVTDLVSTPLGVYILRGDGQGHGGGTFLWDGTFAGDGSANIIAKNTSDSPGKACIYKDNLVMSLFSSSNIRGDSLVPAIIVDKSYQSYASANARTGGVYGPSGQIACQPAVLGAQFILGTKNGFFIGTDSLGANSQFIPLGVTATTGGSASFRAFSWRSTVKQIEGGIVTAINGEHDGAYDINGSWLVFIGSNGVVKILDTAALITSIEVHQGYLYYSKTSNPSEGTFTNIKHSCPQLCRMPLSDILRGKPPTFGEVVSYDTYVAATSGVNGVLGGWPLAGYTSGELDVYASVAGTLTLMSYIPNRTFTGQMSTLRTSTVTFTAGQRQQIDLASYIKSGQILAMKYSVDGQLHARIALT